MGWSRVQVRRDEGEIKMRWVLALDKSYVATCGCNAATFHRVKQSMSRRWEPTSRRSRERLRPTSRCWEPTSRRSREGQK